MIKVAVSSCLYGDKVRYNGKDNLDEDLIKLLKDCEIIKICPEILGGLGVPRNSCEINISTQKVIDNFGNDFTKEFELGAKKALNIIKACDFAVLKSRSPSCGKEKIYDGSFSKKLIDANGKTVQVLFKNDIIVFTENEKEDIKEFLRESGEFSGFDNFNRKQKKI